MAVRPNIISIYMQNYVNPSMVPNLLLDAAEDAELLQIFLNAANHTQLHVQVTDIRPVESGYDVHITATGPVYTGPFGVDTDGMLSYEIQHTQVSRVFREKGYYLLREVAKTILFWAHSVEVDEVKSFNEVYDA